MDQINNYGRSTSKIPRTSNGFAVRYPKDLLQDSIKGDPKAPVNRLHVAAKFMMAQILISYRFLPATNITKVYYRKKEHSFTAHRAEAYLKEAPSPSGIALFAKLGLTIADSS